MSTSNERLLKKPWPLVAGIAFFLFLALCLFFLFAGISTTIDDYALGYIGAYMETNANGEVIMYPTPDYDAANAGVEEGDILLSVNGLPVPPGIENPSELTRGAIGETVTITVRKLDGSQQTYDIVRSSKYQKSLAEAKISPKFMAGYYITLSLFVGLCFAAMGAYLLLRRPTDWQNVLAAFALLFFPLSLNACYTAFNGAWLFNLLWLYNLVRAAGLLLTFGLLLAFPTGTFVPKWGRWALVVVAVWMIPYYIHLVGFQFLPSAVINMSWQAIIALGIGVQVYRYLRVSSPGERQPTRPMVIAAVAALVVYLAAWLIGTLMPGSAMTGGSWILYHLVIEFLVDAVLLFFGFSLMRAIRKLE